MCWTFFLLTLGLPQRHSCLWVVSRYMFCGGTMVENSHFIILLISRPSILNFDSYSDFIISGSLLLHNISPEKCGLWKRNFIISESSFFHFPLTDRFRSRVWWWVTSRISLLNWFLTRASLMAQQIKNLPAMQETQETRVQFLGQEDPPWGGDVNLLQHSCLESAMDRGASWTTVHGVAKSLTGLRAFMCACTHTCVRVCTHTHIHKLTFD